MELGFVNRRQELSELDAHAAAGGLLVVYGRRRVGKTRLITHWLARRSGLYSQAIEASKDQQVEQLLGDLGAALTARLTPRSIGEVLELFDLGSRDFILCLDEFPYLVASDPSLPSVLQRWLDHRKRKRSVLVLAGSSTRMMNDLFLNRSAPLFGRARKLLEIPPMSYAAFCDACRQNPSSAEAFTRYSMVGGVPRYWEFVERRSPLELADELFFGRAPVLEFEPSRLLRDENIVGLTAPAVLEAIGRGANRASEIAARLATPQTNLSRQLQVLLDARLLIRELPFGESVRSSKRTLYRIQDPTLRFWFQVYSPHRSRWRNYTRPEREKLLHDHAATVFEDEMRRRWPGSARYWEGDLELDVVREEGDGLVVSEVKWASLAAPAKRALTKDLEARFLRSGLAKRSARVTFEILDAKELRALGGRV